MYWINNGTYTEKEVREAFGANHQLDVVKVREFNEGKGRDYEYWESITHPETGEKLYATQGFMDHNSNECYYAEYRSDNGRYYNYTAGMNGESIAEQQREDIEARRENARYAEARKNFSEFMSGERATEANSVQNSNLHEINKDKNRF